MFSVHLLRLLRTAPALLALSATAGYAPLGLPESWEFTAPTAAYDPDTGKALGDFQPGVKVKVLEANFSGDTWLVEYPRYNAPPIHALIAIPDLRETRPRDYARVSEDIDTFPLLKKQLEADNPWPGSMVQLKERLLSGDITLLGGDEDAPTSLASGRPMQDGFAWDQMPLEVRLEQKPPDKVLRVILNYWNKGDRNSVVDPRRAYPVLHEKLEKLQTAFDSAHGIATHDANSGINALGNDAELFYLPNDIQAKLRYRPGEYLILELSSYAGTPAVTAEDFTSAKIAGRLQSHVKTSADGERYVSGIPMISQGDKGYCVAATLARVLSYYGYPVDMYAVAKLTETERFGTTLDNVTSSIRRVCGSTPFRMKELDRVEAGAIESVIDKGLPIVWLIPGHCRLIIGINPGDNTIVYSDSWGPEHAYKTMPYRDFLSLNQYMYVLEPQ
jgi:hypothetical protein